MGASVSQFIAYFQQCHPEGPRWRPNSGCRVATSVYSAYTHVPSTPQALRMPYAYDNTSPPAGHSSWIFAIPLETFCCSPASFALVPVGCSCSPATVQLGASKVLTRRFTWLREAGLGQQTYSHAGYRSGIATRRHRMVAVPRHTSTVVPPEALASTSFALLPAACAR